MAEAWRRFGETGKGMPELGLESLAREVTGLELEDFSSATCGHRRLPLQGLFRAVGIRMCVRPSSGNADSGGKPGRRRHAPADLARRVARAPGGG